MARKTTRKQKDAAFAQLNKEMATVPDPQHSPRHINRHNFNLDLSDEEFARAQRAIRSTGTSLSRIASDAIRQAAGIAASELARRQAAAEQEAEREATALANKEYAERASERILANAAIPRYFELFGWELTPPHIAPFQKWLEENFPQLSKPIPGAVPEIDTLIATFPIESKDGSLVWTGERKHYPRVALPVRTAGLKR